MQKIILYKNYLIIAAICVLTFICFREAIHNQFTCWDDDYYVTNDPYIKALTPENLKVIFTKDITKNNYHPFCMLSLAFNYYFSQLNPQSYYLTNVFIHIANVILVFLLLLMLGARLKFSEQKRLFIAGFSALWFGIHPMHVESVCWIAERKDVLYAFFYVAGLITYLKYTGENKMKWYWITLILFIFSCLSKPMAVVFPVSLIFIDFLLQRNWTKKIITEKVMLFVISLICGGGAYYTQSATGAIADFNKLTIAERVMYASYGFDMYISKFFNPTYLSTFYPYPYRYITGYLPAIYYWAPFIAIALPAVPLFLIYKYSKQPQLDKVSGSQTSEKLLPFAPNKFGLNFRVVAFGFGYLFTNLVFVLQFISCGAAIMADRYSYVAYIGWLFMIAYFINELIVRLPGLKTAIFGILLIISGWFSWMCYERTFAWHDSESLLSDAIEKYPMRALLSYKWLGNYYLSIGELDKALDNYTVLTTLHAADAKICDNIGVIYNQKKDYKSAVEAFNESLKYQNNVYKTYLDRALALTMLGDSINAAKDYETALRLNPALDPSGGSVLKTAPMVPAMGNSGQTISGGNHLDSCIQQIKVGDTLKAFRNFILAYKANPGAEKQLAELGFNWVQNKQFAAAINLYGVILKLNSTNGFYYFYRGVAKFSLDRKEDAVGDWLIAMKSNQKDAQQSAAYNLCVAYDLMGKEDLAVSYAEKAQSLGYNVSPEYMQKLKEKLRNKKK